MLLILFKEWLKTSCKTILYAYSGRIGTEFKFELPKEIKNSQYIINVNIKEKKLR